MNQRNDWVNKKFTVCNSDNLYSVGAMKTLLNSSYPNSMIDYDRTALGFETNKIMKFAVIRKDENNYLVDIIEKPSPEEMRKVEDATGRIGVSMNIFRFSYNNILPFLEKTPLHPERHEKDIPEAVRLLIKAKPNSVITYERSEFVPDLTEKNDIADVMEFLKKNKIDLSF